LGDRERADELVLTILIVRLISILRAPKFGGSEILTCRTPTAKELGEYHGTVKWYSPEAFRLDFTPSIVKATLRRDSIRTANEALPRPGRPKKASDRDIRAILRYVRINPKNTYRKIRQELQLSFSSRTIKRILEPFHIRKWQCKQRPELSEETAKLRYQWVLLRKDWSIEEWALIIFSDESSVERGAGGQRQWA
jgi:Transposase